MSDDGVGDAVYRTVLYGIESVFDLVGRPQKYYSMADKYYRRVHDFDVHSYNEQIDPYDVKWLDPCEINYMTRRDIPVRDNFDDFGSVMGGNWDTKDSFGYHPDICENMRKCYDLIHDKNFDNTPLYRAVRQRIRGNKDWTETEYVSRLLKSHNKQKFCWFSSKEEILSRYRKVDKLAKSMNREGAKTYRQLHNESFPVSMLNEVRVDVSRNGNYLLAEGRHRLATAQILGIDEIPVVIMVRHPKSINT